jgi:hypothetical protein
MNTILTTPFTDAPIKNFTFEQFFETFGCNQLDISTFWLMNVGFVNGERRYAHVILRACQIRPLFGPHLVSVFYKNGSEESEMKTFWVHSLTYLRRNLFQFEDRLSFERSTYLIPYQNGSLLIRLKSIRAFLLLPFSSPNSTNDPVVLAEAKEVEESECSDKMRLLLNHHIQCMISYVNREMQTSSEKSIPFIEMYVQQYCNELKVKINKE